MPNTCRILLAQINPTVGDITGNAKRICDVIHSQQAHHDAILFPELALCGYPIEDLLFRPTLHQHVQQSLDDIMAITADCTVVVGHPAFENGQYYNSASIFSKGQRICRYHKQKLPNYGVFDEARYYQKGQEEACIVTIKGYRFGLCICEDIWQPGPVENLLATGMDALLCINASPFDAQKYARRETLIKHIARHGVAVFYVNLTGGQDELVFDGQSIVVDAHGKLVARLPAFEESLATVNFPITNDPMTMSPLLDTTALIYKALVNAVRDYVHKNGFKHVMLGLSGGIDSALTLAIAVDALGAEHVHAVIMPSRYTAPMSIEDANQQAKTMKVNTIHLSIEQTFNALLSTLAPEFKQTTPDLTEENMQARVRGVLLMALSNKKGSLVLNTSNKSESAVGYTTLYGDMVGAFSVLKDVLKTEVYALARYRNSVQAVIPERVLTRAPSAELAEHQTDQDTLPDYAILDAIIKGYMEENLDFNALIQRGLPKADIQRVLTLIKRNEYKRRQSAPGPKISPRAFGKDWRFPITDGLVE